MLIVLGGLYLGFLFVVYALMSASQQADDANDSIVFGALPQAAERAGGAARIASRVVSPAFIERGVL